MHFLDVKIAVDKSGSLAPYKLLAGVPYRTEPFAFAKRQFEFYNAISFKPVLGRFAFLSLLCISTKILLLKAISMSFT